MPGREFSMANKMLIDASHPEETRVVVVRGNRVEEFDFESQSRKQLRGNIYLAKVMRVEPSLQAAFVDYGGNRHGFLAFSEIHPDYYQIPVADRQALLDEVERAARAADAEADERPSGRRRRKRGPKAADAAADEAVSAEVDDHNDNDEEGVSDAPVDAEEEVIESVGSGDALEELPDRQVRVAPKRYKIQEVIRRRQIMLVQVVKEERGNKGAALTTYLSLAGRYSVLMPNTARGGGISRKITNSVDRKRLKSVAQELEVPEGMGVILRTAGASRTKAEIKRDFEYLLRMWENVRDLTLNSTAPALTYEEGSLIKRSIRDLYNKDIDEVLVDGDEGYREAKDFMRMLMPSHAKNVKPYKDAQPVFTRYGVEAQLDAMFSPIVQLRSGGYIVMNQTEALVSIDVNSGRSTREHNIEDTALKTNLEAAEEVSRQLRLRDLAGLVVIDFIDMDEKRNNRAVERKLKECLKNDRARIQVGRISHFGLLEMSRQRIRTGVLESSTVACPHCGGTGHIRSASSVALQLLRQAEDILLRSATHNIVARTRMEVALYVLNQKRAHLRDLEERFKVAVLIEVDEAVAGHQPFLIEKGEQVRSPEDAKAVQAAASAHLTTTIIEEDEPEVEEFDEAGEIIDDDEDEGDREIESSAAGQPAAGEAGQENRRRRRRRRRRRPGNGEGQGSTLIEGSENEADAEAGEADEESEGSAEVTAATQRAEDGTSRRRRRGRRGGRRNRGERETQVTIAGGEVITGEDSGARFDGDFIAGEDMPVIDVIPEDVSEAVATPSEEEAAKPARKRAPRKSAKAKEADATAESAAEDKPARKATAKTAGKKTADKDEAATEKPARKPRAPRKTKAADDMTAEAAAPEVAAAAVDAAPVVSETAEVTQTPEPIPAPVVPPAPPAEPVVISSGTNQPRRSGWWAKAKQALSGE